MVKHLLNWRIPSALFTAVILSLGVLSVGWVKQANPVVEDLVTLHVLGITQDAGFPHIGCKRDCCDKQIDHQQKELVVSLGIADHVAGSSWLFEATPDLSAQARTLVSKLDTSLKKVLPDGIFVSHAHIGHYTGLMYLGKEGFNSSSVPVYCMPRMQSFLTENGPWSQLVDLNNIKIVPMSNGKVERLSARVSVMPFLVPHRDEYSETIGYYIEAKKKLILFIPDINKWELWGESILEQSRIADYVFIDATFFSPDEIPGRSMSEVPHPLVIESMKILQPLSKEERKKVHFIHFNHSNPLLDQSSEAYKAVLDSGFSIAKTGQEFRF